jgi:hypothetical protein
MALSKDDYERALGWSPGSMTDAQYAKLSASAGTDKRGAVDVGGKKTEKMTARPEGSAPVGDTRDPSVGGQQPTYLAQKPSRAPKAPGDFGFDERSPVGQAKTAADVQAEYAAHPGWYDKKRMQAVYQEMGGKGALVEPKPGARSDTGEAQPMLHPEYDTSDQGLTQFSSTEHGVMPGQKWRLAPYMKELSPQGPSYVPDVDPRTGGGPGGHGINSTARDALEARGDAPVGLPPDRVGNPPSVIHTTPTEHGWGVPGSQYSPVHVNSGVAPPAGVVERPPMPKPPPEDDYNAVLAFNRKRWGL